jgi:hypothetical protein
VDSYAVCRVLKTRHPPRGLQLDSERASFGNSGPSSRATTGSSASISREARAAAFHTPEEPTASIRRSVGDRGSPLLNYPPIPPWRTPRRAGGLTSGSFVFARLPA